MGKKNVHKLSDNLHQSLILLGISSHENDYRLSWAFNEFLQLHFVKGENHKLHNPKTNETLEFSKFCALGGETNYRLISNRCPNGFLLDEFKNIDFILLVYLQDEDFSVSEFISKAKTIPLIAAIFQIDPQKIKGKNKLL